MFYYKPSIAFSNGGFSNWSWGQFGNAVGMGALSGAATAGIGQAFGSVGSIGKELGRASAHALSSGGIPKLGGGDFWSGAAAGFIGSGTGSLLHNAKPHWQIAGSALSGGLGAELGGGDFWQGAARGGTIAAINHLSHKLKTIRTTKQAMEHYYAGDGESVNLYRDIRKALTLLCQVK